MFCGTGHSAEVDGFLVRESSLFTALLQFRNVISWREKQEAKRQKESESCSSGNRERDVEP